MASFDGLGVGSDLMPMSTEWPVPMMPIVTADVHRDLRAHCLRRLAQDRAEIRQLTKELADRTEGLIAHIRLGEITAWRLAHVLAGEPGLLGPWPVVGVL